MYASAEKNQLVLDIFNRNIQKAKRVRHTRASSLTIPFSKLWGIEADILRFLPSHPFTTVKELEEAIFDKGFCSDNQEGFAWVVSAQARVHYFGLGCDIDKEKGGVLALCANYLIKETEHKKHSFWDDISIEHTSKDACNLFPRAHSILYQIRPEWEFYEGIELLIGDIQNLNLIQVVGNLNSPGIDVNECAQIINKEIEKGSIDAKVLKQLLAHFFFFVTDKHLTSLEELQSESQELFNEGRIMVKAFEAKYYEGNKGYEKPIEILKEMVDAPTSSY